MEKVHTKEFFFFTFDQIIRELQRDEYYKSLCEKTEKMERDFPIIDKLFYDGNIAGIRTVTQEELQAIKDFVDLKNEMTNLIEREHYIRGHRDCLLYLLRCGILSREMGGINEAF